MGSVSGRLRRSASAKGWIHIIRLNLNGRLTNTVLRSGVKAGSLIIISAN